MNTNPINIRITAECAPGNGKTRINYWEKDGKVLKLGILYQLEVVFPQLDKGSS